MVTRPCKRHWIDAYDPDRPMSQSVNCSGIDRDSRYTTTGNDAIVPPDFGVRVSFRGSVGESLGVSEVGTQPALHPVHASFKRGAHGPCRDTGLVSLTIKPILKGETP